MTTTILEPGQRPSLEQRAAKNARHRGPTARRTWEEAERQFGRFLEEGAELGEGLSTTSGQLLAAYVEWARGANEIPMSAQAFRIRGRRAFDHTADRSKPTVYFNVAPRGQKSSAASARGSRGGIEVAQGPFFPCQRAPVSCPV